jgi:hypothetical protein
MCRNVKYASITREDRPLERPAAVARIALPFLGYERLQIAQKIGLAERLIRHAASRRGHANAFILFQIAEIHASPIVMGRERARDA